MGPMALAAFSIAFALLAPTDAPALDDLVRDYLRSGGGDAQLEDAIVAHPDVSPRSLVAAIRNAALWGPLTPGIHDFTQFLGVAKTPYRVVVSVPEGYDVTRRWPLIVALHGSGSRPEDIMGYVRGLLGERVNEFIIAAPDGFGSMHLRGDAAEVGRPRDLVVALRRQFRLDDRRIFLMGYSLGGHNTWLGGILHADLFAGVMPLATPLQIVGNDLLFEELLPNLANTHTLFCWGRNDNVDANGEVRSDGGNAAWNRHMSQIMRQLGITRFEPVELDGVGHADVRPPAEALSRWLDRKRRRYPAQVRHVFRLAEHSSAYWVRAGALQGEPLPDGPLRIRFKPGEDPHRAQRDELVGGLGLIEAEVEGQTITLRGRKTTSLVLLLHDRLIDLDKPVTIRRGTRKLFHGRIPRDLRVLLREAADDWDFDRLFSARVVVPVGGRVKFGYDTSR